MRLGLAPALGSILAAAVFAQNFQGFEQIVTAELQATHTPGAVIGIVKGGEILDIKGFGVSSVETQAIPTPGMLFRLGSVSKMFTAATLVSLAESGKVDLNAPIGRYLKGIAPCLAKVTAHQLLTHTAGVADDAPMRGPHEESALAANVLSYKADYCFTEPGKVFSYSNPGYVLAGYLASVVGGKPFADIVADRVLKPVGMTSSTFRPLEAMTYPLAQGHDEKMQVIRPAPDFAGGWPSGSLFSSAVDLARWAAVLMGGGQIEGKQVLSPALIAKLTMPYVDMPGGTGLKYAYGLEIGANVWQHGGNRAGYGTTLRMFPAQRAAIIVLGNRTGASLPKTLEAATTAFGVTMPLPAARPASAATVVPGVYSNGLESLEVLKDGARVSAILAGKKQPLTASDRGFQLGEGGPHLEFANGYAWLGVRAYKKR